jgi:hypothetical protein
VPSRAPGLLWLWFASALVFVGAWTAIHHGNYRDGAIIDTPVYLGYADQILAGKVPYRDFTLEYPPGALPVFVLPAIRNPNPDNPIHEYQPRFELVILFSGFLLLAAAAYALRAVGASTRRTALALGGIALAPLLLGPMVLTRFDYWPAAVTTIALALAASGRRRAAAAVLGIAVAIKLYPVAIVPLLVIEAWRLRGRREAAFVAGIVVAAALLVYLPFVLVSPGGVWDSVHKQTGRPLQIETLGSALLLFGHHLFGLRVAVSNGFGSQNLASRYSNLAAQLTTIAELAALVLVWARFARSKTPDADEFLRYAAAAVVAFVAFGKVLSPQFMVWLVPAVALVAGRRGVLAGVLLAEALGATLYWFPGRYWTFIDNLGPELTKVVLLRDLLLVAILVILLIPLRGAREPTRTP